MTPMESTRFDIRRTLGSGGMGVVYEALDTESQHLVALKTLHELSAQGVYRLKKEFRALADIRHRGLVRLDELHCEDGRWFFTMELVAGVPFQEWVGQPVPTGNETLNLTHTATLTEIGLQAGGRMAAAFDESRLRKSGAQLIEALRHLHQLDRVHCDVKSSNVLVTEDERVVLLDFGLIQDLADTAGGVTAGRLEGTVATMAPEQYTDDPVGPAADFYAVGVLLYHGIAGRYPYVGTTAQILAEKQRHAPFPPSEWVQKVPDDLDRLVVALLQPDASKRPDAEAILAVLGATPTVLELQPDARERFFGRARELTQVAATHARGRDDLAAILIRGEAGIGKTSVAREFLRQCAADGLVVLQSRCHEQEAVPLNALDGLVDGLSHYLLGLAPVDAALLLPSDPAALVGAFPVLERVPVIARALGGEPTFHADSLAGAAIGLRAILKGIAKRTGLVLFIDDLQWVDDASLSFLAELIEPGTWPVTVIATARPTASELDPLGRLGQVSAEWPLRFEVLQLGGLDPGDSTALLSDGWSFDDERLRTLTDEADGHPLLLKELARFVATEGDSNRPIELLAALEHRIERMKDRERVVLETICTASIGLDLDLLIAASGLPRVDCALSANMLKSMQLIRLAGRTGSRVLEPYHDRVREAVEARQADPVATAEVHARIARALATRATEAADGYLYAAARHYGLGERALAEDERAPVATLIRRAALAAQLVNDQMRCREYIAFAKGVLGDREADLSFDLELVDLEALYRADTPERAEERFEELVAAVTDPLRVAKLFIRSARMFQRAGQDPEASARMRRGLSLMGYDFPERPGQAALLWQLARTRWAMRGLTAADLADLPLCEDPRKIALQTLISHFGAMAYREGPEVIGTQTVAAMELCVRNGMSAESATAPVGYSFIVGGVFGDWAGADALAQAGIDMADRMEIPEEERVWMHTILGGFTIGMTRPFGEAVALIERAQACVGEDTVTRVLLRLFRAAHPFHLGNDLRVVAPLAEVLIKEGDRTDMLDWPTCGRQMQLLLQVMDGTCEDPEAELAHLDLRHLPEAKAANLHWAWVAFQHHTHFADNPRAAWEAARYGVDNWDDGLCMSAQTSVGIAVVIGGHRVLAEVGAWEGIGIRRAIRKAMAHLEGVAVACPESYAGRAAVCRAELSGSTADIERAIAICDEHEDTHMLAWALEMAGRFEESADAWDRYGAPAKAARLRSRSNT